MPLLEFDKVSKVYAKGPGLWRSRFRRHMAAGQAVKGAAHPALSRIDLQIKAGEAVGLVGESGAGKSTLAAIATGLELPTSGTVRIDGHTPGKDQITLHRLARAVQLIWQDAAGSLDPRMKVGTAVAEPLRIHRLAPRENLQTEVKSLLAAVGLQNELAGRYPHQLSGGEAQRVVIARALALKPKLLICDEPASALDAHAKAQLAELLLRLRQQHCLAYLIVAHDLSLVRRLTERIYVIYKGVIVETGPTAAVLSQPLHPYTRLLMAADPNSPAWAEPGQQIWHPERGGCYFANRCSEWDAGRCADLPLLAEVEGGRAVACQSGKASFRSGAAAATTSG